MTMNLFDVAAELATCVCEALKRGADGTPGERANGTRWDGDCCVVPGNNVAWDSCCEKGGQAWVLIPDGFPTTSFPAADPTGLRLTCNGIQTFAVNIEVGVLRCVCFDMCNCEKKEQNALAVFSDLEAVLTGIMCCFNADSDDCKLDWRIQSFRTLGPEGGCAGSAVTLVVDAGRPCCPDHQ